MTLIENWKAVLLKAWSMWCAYLAFAMYMVETFHADIVAALPILTPLIGDGWAGKLSALFIAIIPAARLFRQTKLALDSGAWDATNR